MSVSDRQAAEDEPTSILDRYFKITELHTNLRTEVIAGISTYLSLAYIFVVNPAILSQAGISKSAVLFATVIVSGLSTLLMGVWAKLPFAVAPGLEMNGFFVFAVVGKLGLTWQQALGTVFWSGVLCIVLTWLPVRQRIIDSIPNGLKTNIAVSVGVFVATIGLFLSKVIVFNHGLPDFSGWSITQLVSHEAIVMYVGLIVSLLLGVKRFKFTGGMLVSIIVGAVVCNMFGIASKAPATLSTDMFSAILQFNVLSVFTDPRCLSVVLIFFIIDFYGGIGKFIGLTAATNLQSGGRVRNIEKGLYVDGIGTVAGSALGTSSLIAFVESAVGIAAGGRTGITAIVCGVLMLCSLIFTPLIGLVPVEATAGILLYVGWLLLPLREHPDSFGRFDKGVGVIMGLLSLLTFSLDKALLVGFWAYAMRQIFSRARTASINWYLLGAAVLLSVSSVMQYRWQ
jgi:AGZA family xanthine/uracil permease-like MFS transporter